MNFHVIKKLIDNARHWTGSGDWLEGAEEYDQYCKGYSSMLAASHSIERDELLFLLTDVLPSRGLIDLVDASSIRITAEGWDFIEGNIENRDSDEGFVAMSFAPDLDYAFTDMIAPAIEDAGYKPIRIDNEQHINRIDYEIIARIRKSRFLVADLTQHKNGVYFEAGFALGLGVPVFWLCSKEEPDEAHFDTRQYNTIFWHKDDMPDGRKRLAERIAAIIDYGPHH